MLANRSRPAEPGSVEGSRSRVKVQGVLKFPDALNGKHGLYYAHYIKLVGTMGIVDSGLSLFTLLAICSPELSRQRL